MDGDSKADHLLRESDELLVDESVEQINLYGEKQETGRLQTDTLPLDEQDSGVFRVSSEVIVGNGPSCGDPMTDHSLQPVVLYKVTGGGASGFNTHQQNSSARPIALEDEQSRQGKTVNDKEAEEAGSPSFTMRIDSFVEFPKSTASDELLQQVTLTNGAKSTSDYGDQRPSEYFQEESKVEL